MKGHWGARKTFWALQRKGSKASWEMVQKVCKLCEICAQFRHRREKAPFGQPFFSREVGHTVVGDVVGPLPTGKGGMRYIHCMVDSATRLGDAMKLRDVTAASILRALQQWVRRNGLFSILVTDNAAYYAAADVQDWCSTNGIEHKFIAPYRHQSVGLVERYHQTLINRVRKMKFISGGSWTDYVDAAVQIINDAVHSVTKFSPKELWSGSKEDLDLAHQRTKQEREYRNRKRKVYPAKFYPGQYVLVWDERPGLTRFQSRWKGPYVLSHQISASVWAARVKKKTGPARIPTLHFHVDQMQPFSIE